MKISIIIPTYNCGKYIQRAIESVLNQPYSDKELIVVDGGSNDNTIEILKSYGDKINWVSERDSGQADAINKGFKIADGEISTWLNADDYYEPNIFNDIVESFKKDKNIVLVYGKQKSIKMNSPMVINIPPKNISVREMIQMGNFIHQPSSFYLLDIVRKVGYLDSNLNYWMEYDLFIKLLKNGESLYLDKILSNFTIREDQKSNLKNIIEMDKELLKISRKHGGSFFSKIFFVNIKHYLTNLFK